MARESIAEGPILVADQEEASRALISSVLSRAGHEIHQAATGEEALEAARRQQPQVVVLEVCLPDLCGYEVCRQLRQEFGNDLPIIFISATRTETFDRVAGLLIGGDDYLAKPFSPDELLARVWALARRTRGVTAVADVPTKLTKRELEVLRLLTKGLGQQEIAEALFITQKTVGTHLQHILAKLGVRSRAQAVAAAYRKNLVDVE